MKLRWLVLVELLGLALAACTAKGADERGDAATNAPTACLPHGGATGAGHECPVNPSGPHYATVAHPLADLPQGVACNTGDTCAMSIDPCSDWREHIGSETVDGYGCACVSGVWSCAVCDQGGSLCADQVPVEDAGSHDADRDGAADALLD